MRLNHVHVGLECHQDLVLIVILLIRLLNTVELLEDLESWDLRNKVFNEGIFVLALIIELFKDEHMGDIEMSKDLFKLSMLVSEHAAASVETHLLVVECSAVLGLEFLVANLWDDMLRQLIIAMGKSAFFTIPTDARVNPILAHLSLVFRLLFRVIELDIVMTFLVIWGESHYGIVSPLDKCRFAIEVTTCESRSDSRCVLSLKCTA